MGSQYCWITFYQYNHLLAPLTSGIGVGNILGLAATPLINRSYLSQMIKHANGQPIWPEARLPPLFVGAFLLPISLFW